MFAEIIKFLSVAFVVIAAYTFDFYFILDRFDRVNIIGEKRRWQIIYIWWLLGDPYGTHGYHENSVVIIGFLILTNCIDEDRIWKLSRNCVWFIALKLMIFLCCK